MHSLCGRGIRGAILHDKLCLTAPLRGGMASFAIQLWGLHLSGALVRCEEIKEAVCSKVLKVCIGMARLN
jgi:hypothetical protein